MKIRGMKIILSLLITFYSLDFHSQEEMKGDSPIIFGEFLFGGAGRINGNSGIMIGGTLNYQYKKALVSLRYMENSQLESDVYLLTPVTPFPILKEKHFNKETALLLGKRWIYNRTSLSISGGVSLNTFTNNLTDENEDNFRSREVYAGFPLEVNFKWFKSEKKRYRIFYGLVPIGKPTSFGDSFGFKLIGNISRNSFVGLGITAGLGVHKKY